MPYLTHPSDSPTSRTPRSGLIRALVVTSLVFASSSSWAWTVDNQTDVLFNGFVANGVTTILAIQPNSQKECAFETDPCTGVSINYVARHEVFDLVLATGGESDIQTTGFSCRVEIRGDGDIVIEEIDRSGFERGSQASLGPAYRCRSTARLSASNCDPFPAPPISDGLCVGSLGSVQVVDERPYVTAPGSPRDIRFLATGDPQFWESGDNDAGIMNANAVMVMQRMQIEMILDPEVRGVIVSGDLTQDAKDWDFDTYKSSLGDFSHYFFEGLGNHDMECAPGFDCGSYTGDGKYDTAAVVDYVYSHTNESMAPRVTPKTNWQPPHYSWDWHDVHFVQTNLYPGLGVDSGVAEGYRIDPAGSLLFMGADLDAFAPITNDVNVPGKRYAKPVVLVHHYNSESSNWSNGAKASSWNEIFDHNVIALITGHAHPAVDGDWTDEWNQNSGGGGGVTRDANLNNKIPDFIAGAARGPQSALLKKGAYIDVTLDGSDRMLLKRMNEAGVQDGPTEVVEFETCWFENTDHFFDLVEVAVTSQRVELELRTCINPGETQDVEVIWRGGLPNQNLTLTTDTLSLDAVYPTAGDRTITVNVRRTRNPPRPSSPEAPISHSIFVPEPEVVPVLAIGVVGLIMIQRRRLARGPEGDRRRAAAPIQP